MKCNKPKCKESKNNVNDKLIGFLKLQLTKNILDDEHNKKS